MQGRYLRALDYAAHGAEMARQGKGIELGISDGVPARREGAMGESAAQAGLDLSHADRIEVMELNAVRFPRLPAGKRGLQLGLALIDLKIAVLAQHGGAGLRQKRLELGLRKVHQRCLRRCGMRHPPRRAGAPEPEHPRCDLQGTGRRDRQWTERVEQPLRCFLQDAGRGKRQDVGEGEGAGVACRCSSSGTFSVEHDHRKPSCLGRYRRG